MAQKRKRRRGRKRAPPPVIEGRGKGRPSSYTLECSEIAYGMTAGGATDAEVAEELGISVPTFYAWRAKYPEFLKATQMAKEIANERVENSLFSRAAGHRHRAVKIFLDKDGGLVYAPYTEILPPDTNAARHWLNNRNPDRWKDKSEVDVDADVKIVVKGGLPGKDDKG